MPYYVNLPISYAARERWYLDYFTDNGVSPELGMDTDSVQALSDEEHSQIAACFSEKNIRCGIHLPFFDLHAGSLNDSILNATRETLLRAVERAQVYSPVHFIGHAAFDASQHSQESGRYDEWLQRSAQTWTMLMEVTDAPLYLENTHEKNPEILTALVELLRAENGDARVGVCFDLGHWHSFAGGSLSNPAESLTQWMQVLAPYIGHLHLHDNDGTSDQHLGIGSGSIPFDVLFAELAKNNVSPTVTLEPHDEESFYTSLAWFSNNEQLVRKLNV